MARFAAALVLSALVGIAVGQAGTGAGTGAGTPTATTSAAAQTYTVAVGKGDNSFQVLKGTTIMLSKTANCVIIARYAELLNAPRQNLIFGLQIS
jgi:hypothetical protein